MGVDGLRRPQKIGADSLRPPQGAGAAASPHPQGTHELPPPQGDVGDPEAPQGRAEGTASTLAKYPLPALLRDWKPGTYSKSHLWTLVELCHETIKVRQPSYSGRVYVHTF